MSTRSNKHGNGYRADKKNSQHSVCQRTLNLLSQIIRNLPNWISNFLQHITQNHSPTDYRFCSLGEPSQRDTFEEQEEPFSNNLQYKKILRNSIKNRKESEINSPIWFLAPFFQISFRFEVLRLHKPSSPSIKKN